MFVPFPPPQVSRGSDGTMPSSFSAWWTLAASSSIIANTMDNHTWLEIFTHLSCALSLSAFLVRDMIWLRGLAIGSSLVWIGAMVGTGHLIVASIFWNTLFVSINTWQILAILREDRSVDFTEEERGLFEGLFRGFKPGEFLKILRLGEWQDLSKGQTLLEEGENAKGFWLLTNGEAEVRNEEGETKASLGANDLVGELGYLTGAPASATVQMVEPGRALFWQKNRLESFFRLNPTLKFGCHSVISSNLAEKLRR